MEGEVVDIQVNHGFTGFAQRSPLRDELAAQHQRSVEERLLQQLQNLD